MSSVAIPIETKVREFHGKLWLGLNLVDNSHKVILGPADEIKYSLIHSEPDVYITKDPGDGNIEFFESLNTAGCLVCGLDTEGGVYSSLENFDRNKNEAPKYFDFYFMWGQAQAELLKERVTNPDTIVTTGNPRFDLLSEPLRSIYSYESEQLRKKYGNYVLFNMNFSWANHFKPDDHIKQQQRLFGEYDMDKYRYISELYNEFITAIHSLRPDQSEYNIIIRPHPSEDHTTYERNFRNYENVFVEHDGDVRNWISGANVVVHNSCTTGIEAAMMECPVLAYRPIQNEKYDKELPNIVSEEIFTRDELTDRISHYTKNTTDYQMNTEQQKELKQYFHNLDLSAAQKITEYIDTLKIPEQQSYSHLQPELAEQLKLRIKASNLSNLAIKVYDSANAAFGNTEPAQQREYRRQKFSGLTTEEIHTTLSRFDTDIQTENITVSPVSRTQDTFILERK